MKTESKLSQRAIEIIESRMGGEFEVTYNVFSAGLSGSDEAKELREILPTTEGTSDEYEWETRTMDQLINIHVWKKS